MRTIRELMAVNKDTAPWSVESSATVFQALQMMADKNVGAILVLENGQIVGVFSERDYARKIILRGKCSLETSIKEVMTKEMVVINPETTLEESLELMSKWHIRHLPVLEQGRLAGMVSMRDVVDAILSMKESTIKNLEDYILGYGYNR